MRATTAVTPMVARRSSMVVAMFHNAPLRTRAANEPGSAGRRVAAADRREVVAVGMLGRRPDHAGEAPGHGLGGKVFEGLLPRRGAQRGAASRVGYQLRQGPGHRFGVSRWHQQPRLVVL